MWDKTTDMVSAIAAIPDGASVMLGGFGVPGTPFCLIEELVRHGARDLTVIKNDANEQGMGVDWLLENGQVRKLIASHIGLNPRAVRMMNDGKVEIELVPQGILAERIRSAGAGLLGFVTDIGLGTPMCAHKQHLRLDGREGVFEPALNADFALVHASRGDSFGNLAYAAAARNFNPLMAMAATVTIAEAESITDPGAIPSEQVHTPGPFVDRLVPLPELPEVYGVVRR